jgi:hypothetical protein
VDPRVADDISPPARPRASGVGRLVAALHSGRGVVAAGLVLVALQLAFRAWAALGSWFYFDDLAFMSQAMNRPFDLDYLFQSYGGHLMPAGFAAASALTSVAAYTWWPWALFLLGLQALAGVGMLRLLVSMFGPRPLVVGLLAGYLSYVFTLSAGIWWAAGINQLPMLVALTFGLHAFLEHLRSRSTRPLVVALAWTVAGLAFYEKTILLIGVYAIVALAYFTTGDTPTRLRQLWSAYRSAVISFAALGAGYLALYVGLSPDLTASQDTDNPWGLLTWNLVMVSFASALVGGPLRWESLGMGSLADPPSAVQLVAWAALAGLVYHAVSTRTRSVRAWIPLAFTMTATAVLLASNRAGAVGPAIAREYRYQPESAALFVIGAGLALLPLLGAIERNDRRAGAATLWERTRYVAPGVAVVAALATVSATTYVSSWHENNRTRDYFDNVRAALKAAPEPPPLVDIGIPQDLLWSYRYPENTYSHVFRRLAGPLRFPTASIDQLYVFDDDGHLAPVSIPPTRSMQPTEGCGHRFDDGAMRIPLDGPVIGGGWWIQLSYASTEAVDAEIVAGDNTHELTLPRGIHNAYLAADGEFTEVFVHHDSGAAPNLCVTALTLGLPIATPRTP